MLKGLDTIDEIVNGFTAQFGIAAELSNVWENITGENLVRYSFFIPSSKNDDNNYFDAVMEEIAAARGMKLDVDGFVKSLLHEIGHAMVEDDLSDKAWQDYDRIRRGICNGTIPQKEYYYAEVEYEASRWAVNYMIDHSNELANWWCNILQPAIKQFYILNNVKENPDYE